MWQGQSGGRLQRSVLGEQVVVVASILCSSPALWGPAGRDPPGMSLATGSPHGQGGHALGDPPEP